MFSLVSKLSMLRRHASGPGWLTGTNRCGFLSLIAGKVSGEEFGDFSPAALVALRHVGLPEALVGQHNFALLSVVEEFDRDQGSRLVVGSPGEDEFGGRIDHLVSAGVDVIR